uniref:Transglycosylase SLT domain-containing protein n=1 Tax=Thermoanaerobaculum aquaticum TaxID=1312852 RepID=A0A7C2NJF5_9BACT
MDGSQDLAYVYDKAGRLVQVKQASGAVLAEYTYGAANSGSNYALGKLVLAVRHNATDYGDEVVSESFTYGGRMGRLSGKQTQLALRYPRLETRTFVQSFVWNELGDLASQGYPDDQGLADPARVVSYGYDNGYLTAVGGFVTSQVYHANGMVFRRSLANGVMEEVALDSSKMARPGQMRVVGPSGQEYWNSGTFVYDGVGNVKALVRSSTDQDVYVYDLVSRLVYARFKTAGGGTKEESLSYDAFGNLLSSVTPPTDYGSRSWSVDGVNRLAGCGYDAAGRMTACGGLTLSWTAAGELGKVQGTGINRSFLYTASGEKVMVRNELLGTAAVSLRDLGGNPVRHYLYSGGSWSWLGDDIFVGRLRIAQVTSSGTRYFHVDHLGSVRRVSTGAGALEKAYDFFPYGLPVKETVGQERLWFGGYELEHQNTPDYTDDLYFLHARWYFPSMARFLSPDPVRGDPAQPQSLNLYAYVRGNPLNAVDPDGRAALWLTPSRERAMAMAASEADFVDSLAVWMLMKDMIWYALPQQSPGAGGGGGNPWQSSQGGGGGASAGTGSNQTNTSSTPENRRLTYAEVAEIVKENNQSGQADEVIIAIAWMESSFDPGAHRPNPEKETARGLMGVTKAAAQDVGANYERLFDPVENIKAGSAYLRLRTSWAKGNVEKALAGYGTGPNYAQAILRCAECLKASAGEPMTCLVQLHP